MDKIIHSIKESVDSIPNLSDSYPDMKEASLNALWEKTLGIKRKKLNNNNMSNKKKPTKAEVMSKQYSAVMKSMQETTAIMDEKEELMNYKMSLQGTIMIGIVNAIRKYLPELESKPEESLKVWKDIYLVKDELYVIREVTNQSEEPIVQGDSTSEGEN